MTFVTRFSAKTVIDIRELMEELGKWIVKVKLTKNMTLFVSTKHHQYVLELLSHYN